jgi:four helix bundle protein
MSEQADRLKERTFQFALDVIELTKTFPAEEPGPTVRRQLTKAATSVGANYRAACRARSHADFTSRIGIVAEESDESVYWLDVAGGAKLTRSSELPRLQQESRELTAVFSRG